VSDVVGALSAEVERLRRLVGPSERGFGDLTRDVEVAQSHVRRVEMEAGELRGRLTEMNVELSRARQDQDLLMRQIEMSPAERWADLANRRWTSSVAPRLRRITRSS
jgi:hypothetical protein